MKTVAVIVAGRQASAWLQQCITSIAAQNLPRSWNLHILLGIDACPSTMDAAKRLRIQGLQVTYFPEHVGPYVIFNSLASRSRSDVLVRFDADDVMLGEYLRSQLETFPAKSVPFITQTWSIYVDERLRSTCSVLANGKTTRPDGRRAAGSDGQFAMSQAVWDRLGAFRAWWCHADSEFLRRAEWAGVRRSVIPSYLYLRRVHPQSLTQSKETGYISNWRKHYAQQIAAAVRRYSGGESPERVHPAVARHLGNTPKWPGSI
jgi:glycosyltransferase involved in cell wall biosynthesis